MKNTKAITLVALVITVIVLLILAGITFATLSGNQNILQMANNATEQYKLGSGEDQNVIDEANYLLDTYFINNQEKTPIDLTTRVGCYADFNDDGIVDGIIYADLAVGCNSTWNTSGNSDWSDYGNYNLTAVTTGLKQYYVKGKHTGNQVVNGEIKSVTKDIIAPIDLESTLTSRFYIVALSDEGTSTYAWGVKGESYTLETTDEINLGTGKTNTAILMTQLGSNTNYLWSAIQLKVAQGWYVMSRAEWSACSKELNIPLTNYSDLGYSNYYWSSSQYGENTAWMACYKEGAWGYIRVGTAGSVRLGLTF